MSTSNLLIAASVSVAVIAACIHDPIIPEGFDPDAPTGPTGTTGTTGVTGPTGDPCDPSTIYFSIDVQPILSSSCAVPGCHDAATAEDGVILVDYASTVATADVRPGDPEGSDIYEVLTEDDPDDIMPPPSSGIILTGDQINIIREWIAQGAQDLTCNPTAGGCNTDNVTFSGTVWPIIANNCRGCHSGTSPQAGISLTGYAGVKSIAQNGMLEAVITHADGVTPMPYNQPQLSDCKISQIQAWIADGAPNN